MASPVRRDAGSLCGQAGLSCTPHRLANPRRPSHTALLFSSCSGTSILINRTQSRPDPEKTRTNANSAGKACLKSKVCEPGRASPIRMDAGSLCDQAGFSCTTHRLTRSSNPPSLLTRTIRRDAGSLCDQAGLSSATHLSPTPPPRTCKSAR